MTTIKTLEDALDHAELSRDCVSTSAKAMTILADEIHRLRDELDYYEAVEYNRKIFEEELKENMND